MPEVDPIEALGHWPIVQALIALGTVLGVSGAWFVGLMLRRAKPATVNGEPSLAAQLAEEKMKRWVEEQLHNTHTAFFKHYADLERRVRMLEQRRR